MKPAKTKPNVALAKAAADNIEDLLRKVQDGDPAVLPQLREMLTRSEAVDLFGNVARRVEIALIEGLSGKNLGYKEGTARKLAEMRADLAGPNPTPLELQLVERVVLCWLALYDTELRSALSTGLAPDQGEFWQQRIDRAHRRYLSAIKTLATVRRLAVPVLIGQVNIARRQVNVTQVGATGSGGKQNPAPASHVGTPAPDAAEPTWN